MPLESLVRQEPRAARLDTAPTFPRRDSRDSLRQSGTNGVLPMRKAMPVNDQDAAFLTSLAAMQVNYGQPHEAVAYLMALRRMRPGDTDVLRLLAIAFMKMERWSEAAHIVEELDEIAPERIGMLDLYRAVIRFRLSDRIGAKAFFARFIKRREQGEGETE